VGCSTLPSAGFRPSRFEVAFEHRRRSRASSCGARARRGHAVLDLQRGLHIDDDPGIEV